MPLDTNDPVPVHVFDCLDQPIWSEPGWLQVGAETIDSLMVIRTCHFNNIIPNGAVQERRFLDGNRVGRCPMIHIRRTVIGKVLEERSTQCHVEQLHASADCKDGLVLLKCSVEYCQFEIVK